VRVLLGRHGQRGIVLWRADGTTNGAHNDITRVTRLLHHAVGEMGMYRKTRLNFGALASDGRGAGAEWTTKRAASWKRRASGCTAKPGALLARFKPLTEHLAGKLLEAGEMSLKQALFEIRRFEAA
jgi:cell division protease FtsH